MHTNTNDGKASLAEIFFQKLFAKRRADVNMRCNMGCMCGMCCITGKLSCQNVLKLVGLGTDLDTLNDLSGSFARIMHQLLTDGLT